MNILRASGALVGARPLYYRLELSFFHSLEEEEELDLKNRYLLYLCFRSIKRELPSLGRPPVLRGLVWPLQGRAHHGPFSSYLGDRGFLGDFLVLRIGRLAPP